MMLCDGWEVLMSQWMHHLANRLESNFQTHFYQCHLCSEDRCMAYLCYSRYELRYIKFNFYLGSWAGGNKLLKSVVSMEVGSGGNCGSLRCWLTLGGGEEGGLCHLEDNRKGRTDCEDGWKRGQSNQWKSQREYERDCSKGQGGEGEKVDFRQLGQWKMSHKS